MLTASKLDLAFECLHWTTLSLPEDQAGEAARWGTAFHALAANHVNPALSTSCPELEEFDGEELRTQFDGWKKAWSKRGETNELRAELAFAMAPDGSTRLLGEDIGRDYEGHGATEEDLCGTVDVVANWGGERPAPRDHKTGAAYSIALVGWQLRFAAVCIADLHPDATEFPSSFDYVSATGRINRDEHVRPRHRVEKDRARLVVLNRARLSGDTPAHAGTHCEAHYCPARGVCRTYRRANS